MDASSEPIAEDDLVIPFRVEQADASGRLVRLGPAVDEILSRHDYPAPVAQLLGEALLLVALIGSAIKERNAASPIAERFILQTQTDGPVNLIVADYHAPGHLRGYARFDRDRLDADTVPEQLHDQLLGQLLGKGHLALTIDRGADTDRYQGIVALGDSTGSHVLAEAANRYFEQSEQLPTTIHLAMAQHFGGEQSHAGQWRWRGGALMVRKLTPVGGHRETREPDEDSWNRVNILADTIKAHELSDPLLAPRDLLVRLFHEDGVRVFDPVEVAAGCSCSPEGVTRMLAGFDAAEQREMVEPDGKVHITCEFCNRSYALTPTI